MDGDVKIEGLIELGRKLNRLSTTVAGKALRNATASAVLPAFKAIKAAAPVGNGGHKTYKGRTVAPGFLKRSVRRKSRFKNGKATVLIGVKPEAFYGVQFLDRGIEVDSRKGKSIKSYKISGRNWMKQSFIEKRREIESRFKQKMKAAIEKATR